MELLLDAKMVMCPKCGNTVQIFDTDQLASDLAAYRKALSGANDEVIDHYEMLVREYGVTKNEELSVDAIELKE